MPSADACDALTPLIWQKHGLHGAGQTGGEQLGEPRRVVECAAFSEKGCAIEQFGGLGERGVVAAFLVCLAQAGDQRMIRIELENPLPDRNHLPGGTVHARERRRDPEGVGAVEGTAVTPASFDHAGLSVGVLARDEHCRSAAIPSAIHKALQRGVIAVERADVVVADRLAPLELLAELSPHVEVIDAAKIPTGGPWPRTPSTPS